MGDGALFEYLPPEIKQAIYSMASVTGLAWLGRMLWHVRQVQKAQRRFWSWHLLWELLIALSFGLAADGVAEFFGFTGKAATGAIIIISYLGPAWIEIIVLRVVDAASGTISEAADKK